MNQYIGNIHVHSTYSDGHATVTEIARAAKRAGLAFVIITDHNTLQGLPEEGYHHEVLVLVGSEINKKFHHYLALNIKKEVPVNDEDPQQVIDNVNTQGGLGFIAHPCEKGSPLVYDSECYPWHNWDVTGFAGIEVWNWCSQWRDAATTIPRGLFYAYLNPAGPIKGPDPESMARFDALSQTRCITAIAGSDAHAWPIHRGPVRRTIFPYEYQFRTANNCVLLDNPLSKDLPTAKAQIYQAISRGKLFIVNSLHGDPSGFSFKALSGTNEHHIGDTVALQTLTGLQVACPDKYRGRLRHRIIHNGRLLNEYSRCNVTVRIHEPGTYRLEVYSNNRPWIFTNPIYVT